jgi:hypothetical protein
MRTLISVGFAALLTSSCIGLELRSPMVSAESEHYWRVDEHRDVVEFLQIEHGVIGYGDARFWNQIAGGARVIAIEWFPIDVAAYEQTVLEAGDEPDPVTALLKALGPTFRVSQASIVTDEQGRATLWRVCAFDGASEWLRALERLIFEEAARGNPEALEPIPALTFDADSQERFFAQARNGEPLWRLDRDGFLVEAAMTRENAESCIASLDRADVDASYESGRLRLRYSPGPGGWIPARWLHPSADVRVEYDPAIVRQLEEAGCELGTRERYRALRAASGLR